MFIHFDTIHECDDIGRTYASHRAAKMSFDVITHNVTFPGITFRILLPWVARRQVVNCGMGKVTWFCLLVNHVHSVLLCIPHFTFHVPHFTDTQNWLLNWCYGLRLPSGSVYQVSLLPCVYNIQKLHMARLAMCQNKTNTNPKITPCSVILSAQAWWINKEFVYFPCGHTKDMQLNMAVYHALHEHVKQRDRDRPKVILPFTAITESGTTVSEQSVSAETETMPKLIAHLRP